MIAVVGRLIVTTGSPLKDGRTTEIFDLVNENESCFAPDFPMELYGAVGGFVGGQDIICGGGDPPINKCFDITNGKEVSFSLKKARRDAISVNLEENFFVFGGRDEKNDQVDSFEIFSKDFHIEKNLPFSWELGCAVSLSQASILLIGGYQNGVRETKTWIFNFGTEVWTQGPEMKIARQEFGCGKVKNFVAVLGGFPYTSTTELLYENQFEFGKCQNFLKCEAQNSFSGEEMPMKLDAMSVAQDPSDDSSLIITGGRQTNGQLLDTFLRFHCDESNQCFWQIMSQMLRIPRSRHISTFTKKPLNCTNKKYRG